MSSKIPWAARVFLSFSAAVFFVSHAVAASLSGTDIGGALDGGTVAASGGYNLTSRSSQIGGTADQLHFASEARTGNFDIQVRVERVSITDAFVQAGLMARDTQSAGARFAGIFATSAQIGTYFESRSTASGSAQIAQPVTFPVNYPQMFLRLRRAGNVFTGFASFDGEKWQQLGSATITMPSTVNVGLALCSQNSKAVASASFRDYKNVTSTGSFTYKPVTEPLGPANRQTGMVFSEIMYHPGPQAGTNDAEFIEVYNAESIFIDLSGWRISGGVEYTFPDGFQLQAGQFAVVAADPAAMARVYGITNALGPWSGHLDNAGDTIRLLNVAGAIRLEVKYRPEAPWPASADGAGHSLILAKPSYGENDPRAWAASAIAGGSPGEVDAIRPTAADGVVINEFLAHTDDPAVDFIELFNRTGESVDISGCVLTDRISTNKFRVPPGTILPGRGRVSFDQNQMGFSLSADGETIFLLTANSDRVLDAVRFGSQENGVSCGRLPDGGPEFRRLSAPTPGAANGSLRPEAVVINELMYDPLSGDADDEYVEIYNQSNASVDLSGWRLEDAIDYKFPEGTRIPAGGYFVVGHDRDRLLANYPQLNANNTFGNFDGKLSGSGEHVALTKRDFSVSTNELGLLDTNTLHITVSEVTYYAGGRWAENAHGGGSSLELIDARADTMRAANWAASDETAKAAWTEVSFTGRLDNGQSTHSANRFQVIPLGAGECLIDDLEFIPAGSTNLLVNGDFEKTTNLWKFFGNQSKASIEVVDGSRVLHVRAPDNGDTGNNAIRGDMYRSVTSGTATIRAKVRWLSGWPEILLRIRGNWIELPAEMQVPKNLGTPGLPNSRAASNAAPAIYDVTHTPALPRSGEAVAVTCRISDPDGVAQPLLRYRIDPSQTLTTVTMRDDGTGGDAFAGDGIYTAMIPSQSSLAAFRIEATDDAAQSAKSIFPDDAPARECLVRWNDSIPFGNFRHYHLWSTAATESARNGSIALNNTYRDATLVYGNWRVIYNAGFRDKGSPYHGGSGDFAVSVPADDMLLGVTDRIFASTGNGGNEGTDMAGDVSGWIGEKLGIPFLHSHYMRLYRNGGMFREVLYDMEQPTRQMAKNWFGGGDLKDDLFKISVWFEYDDSNSPGSGTSASTSATLGRFLSENKPKLARYRWNWEQRSGNETANDYTSIFNLADAANNSVLRVRTLPVLADLEEWMRVFAFDRILGNWDSWSYNVGQNMFLYTPLGQRAVLMPWDIDFVLGQGDGPTSALFNAGEDGAVQALMNLPVYRRMLWRAYQDAMNGPLQTANFQPQIDARKTALSRNGVSTSAPTGITSFMNSRRNYIGSQIKNADAPALTLTSNGGEDFTTASGSVQLTGAAPLAVASIEVNGVPYPVTWLNTTNWQITVPLGAPTNVLAVAGRDLRGNLLANAAASITIHYTGSVPNPRDYVVFNEIMYNPPEEDAGFIELYNSHPTFAFDLSGFKVRGVDFTFPAGTLIQPNGFLVVAENRAAFAAAYGAAIPLAGTYSGKLQRGGETLKLVKPAPDGEEVLDDIRYDNSLPWPALADGFGPSLQLIDPAQDNWRVANWAATGTNDLSRATPGQANAVQGVLDPFPAVWLNEIQPVNANGAADNTGEHEPWIELYNSGSSTVDLSGLYLSDDPLLPAKWQFEAGARIAAGQFLRVWADGQPQQTSGTDLHANFRLGTTNGIVLLTRIQGGAPAVLDYVKYLVASPDYSFGSYPDGEPRKRRQLYVPTPLAPNNATIPGTEIYINEWTAAAQSLIRDPADGQFKDWFELYNAGTNTVDLGGFFLTDSTNSPTQFQIPAGFQIPPHGYRLVWANSDASLNAPGRDLHVNFSLKSEGEQLALYSPDEIAIDSVVFGQQAPNISEGRYPDGAIPPFVTFSNPTPGISNTAQFANQPPSVTTIPDSSVREGELLGFKAVASDPDAGQKVVFSLLNPPEGARIDPATGDFAWTPSESQGPGTYNLTVIATDNGTPVRIGLARFVVTVSEVNQLPVIKPIADAAVDEGAPLVFTVEAADPDIPVQTLNYTLGANAPAGAAIDPATGEFSWIPEEGQGGSVYPVTVIVSDATNGTGSSTAVFRVQVRSINNPPVLDPIAAQSIDEETPFSLQLVAHDPETPPANLTWSLDSAPPGMTINPATGMISWTPGEDAGPGTYNVAVRVSEPGGTPFSTANFVMAAREVNTPPALRGIADFSAAAGQLIVITNFASDTDLPAQTIRYSGNLPRGATVDAQSGVFAWQLGDDPPAGTNQVTITATDDGVPSLSTNITFNVIIHAPSRVAINEIMQRPSATNAEYIELLNYSEVNDIDISGWRLQGYDWTFPANTVLPPGGLICVAHDLAAFRAAYGSGPVAMGNAAISIPASGGLIRLLKPAPLDEVVDEVAFIMDAPWPLAALNGASMQLIDPFSDHRRAINWSASNGGTVTNDPVSVVPMAASWSYWQEGSLPGANWTAPDFADQIWPAGGALLYVEGASLPAPKTTPLELGQRTYYFRTHFSFAGNPDKATLRFFTVIDDGAVFYLNGHEVFRLGMAAGTPNSTTFSSRTVGDAVLEGPFEYPATGMVSGDNVLAAEVHQINSGSSDIVFGSSLDIITVGSLSATPGAPNIVSASLPQIPPVWINEVLPGNSSGLTDNAGEHDPWIELYNGGEADVNLNGWALSNDLTALLLWEFPPDAWIPAHGYLVVWADGQTMQSTTAELHAGFRLRASSGSVVLVARQNTVPVVADFLQYAVTGADQSYGSVINGDPAVRALLNAPTPGGDNAAPPPASISAVATLAADGMHIAWNSSAGRKYQVQSCADLAAAQWTVNAEYTGSGAALEHVEKLDGKAGARFFRLAAP